MESVWTRISEWVMDVRLAFRLPGKRWKYLVVIAFLLGLTKCYSINALASGLENDTYIFKIALWEEKLHAVESNQVFPEDLTSYVWDDEEDTEVNVGDSEEDIEVNVGDSEEDIDANVEDGDADIDADIDADVQELEEEFLNELDFDAVDDLLEENDTTRDMTFLDVVNRLLDIDGESGKSVLVSDILGYAFGDLKECREMLVQILLLTIAFSFLNQFVNLFENSQISKTGMYMFFLILMVLLMKSYLLMEELLGWVLGQTVEVMQALIPALCATMMFASEQTSAAIFYQLAVLVIWLVERLLTYVVAPGIHIYVVLQMLNCMTSGKLISKVTQLLKTLIRWTLRAMLTGVTGMNMIENMIAPSMDNLKKLSITKTLGMIPGLGGVTEAVGNIFLGSAAVIKNAVGAATMVVLVCIVLQPVLKLMIFAIFYRLASALMQPFADRRVCGCIDSVSEGAAMLLRTMVTGTLLFLITIAIVITAAR